MSPRFQSLCVIAFIAAASPAFAQDRPQGDILGQVSTYTVAPGDTLASIARRAELGLTELVAANPTVTSAKVHPGMILTLPGRHLLPMGTRSGIVVNLAEMRLFRFLPDGRVLSAPISVGREGWDTPAGTTKVIEKREDPVWTVPASIRAENPKLPEKMPPGPDNPLGKYALTLGWPGYLIHGTNAPSSVGKPSSHGCMRMYPEDIAALYAVTPVGETVTVIDTPVTLGQQDGILYLQVTPTRDQAIKIVNFSDAPPLPESDGFVRVLQARLNQMKGHGAQIDDNAVNAAIARHDGIPVAIGKVPVRTVASARTTQPKTWLDQVVDWARNAWAMVSGGR